MRSSRSGPIEWHFTANSDPEGRYRIEAAPAYYYAIGAHQEEYIGYSDGISGEDVEKTLTEKKVVRHDIKLTPGIKVHGLVVEDSSGEALAGVAVTYRPEKGNSHAKREHDFNRNVLTDDQGKFTLPTPPGKGSLLAEINSDEYIRVPFPMSASRGDSYPHARIEIDVAETERWESPRILQTVNP